VQILVLIGTVGASPHIAEILPLCDFFDCPVQYFLSGTRPGRTDEPISTHYGSNDVFPRKEVSFRVRTIGHVIWGKYAPKTPKMGVNRQFQAKTANYNIAISRKIQIRSRPNLLGGLTLSSPNPIWLAAAILNKNRYDIITQPRVVRF